MKRKKLLTVVGSICLILVLAALLLPACAEEVAPTPTAEPITWKYSSFVSGAGVTGKASRMWAKAVEEKSHGLVTFEFYDNSELLGGKDNLEGTQAGIADISYIAPSYYLKALSIHNFTFLPCVVPARGDWTGWARYQMADHPALKAELDKYNLTFAFYDACAPHGLFTKKPVRKIEDLKGMKIKVSGPTADLLEKFGAVPVQVGYGEIYTSLDTGLLDGCIVGFASGVSYEFYTVSNYWHDGFDLQSTACLWAMNTDSFNALPKDIQDFIQGDEIHELMARYQQYLWYDPDMMKEVRAHWAEEGLEFVQFPPEELAKMRDMSKDVWEEWIEESGGEPARDVLDQWFVEVDKTIKKYPNGILPLYTE